MCTQAGREARRCDFSSKAFAWYSHFTAKQQQQLTDCAGHEPDQDGRHHHRQQRRAHHHLQRQAHLYWRAAARSVVFESEAAALSRCRGQLAAGAAARAAPAASALRRALRQQQAAQVKYALSRSRTWRPISATPVAMELRKMSPTSWGWPTAKGRLDHSVKDAWCAWCFVRSEWEAHPHVRRTPQVAAINATHWPVTRYTLPSGMVITTSWSVCRCATRRCPPGARRLPGMRSAPGPQASA